MRIECQEIKTIEEISGELNDVLAQVGDLLGEENLLWLSSE